MLAAWVSMELQQPLSSTAVIVSPAVLYKLLAALSSTPELDYPQGSLKVHRAEAIDRLRRHLEHAYQFDTSIVATDELMDQNNTAAHADFLWQLFEIFVVGMYQAFHPNIACHKLP
jgi:hypothetical protein